MPRKNREELRQYMREWERRKLADPEYRKKHNERKARERRERRKADPDQARILDRRDWLQKEYGVTPEWYDVQLARQNDVCAICKKKETFKHWRSGKLRRFHVDHNHTTGETRGLLCQFCNHRLYLIEYPEIFMDAALAYLAQYAH